MLIVPQFKEGNILNESQIQHSRAEVGQPTEEHTANFSLGNFQMASRNLGRQPERN